MSTSQIHQSARTASERGGRQYTTEEADAHHHYALGGKVRRTRPFEHESALFVTARSGMRYFPRIFQGTAVPCGSRLELVLHQ